jgi:hypothetical protein
MNPTLTRALARASIDPNDTAALNALASELRRLGFMGESAGDLLLSDICTAYGLSGVAATEHDGARRWTFTSKESESRTAYMQPEGGWTHDGTHRRDRYERESLTMLGSIEVAATEAALAGELLSVLHSVAEAGQTLTVERFANFCGEQTYRLPNGWAVWVYFDCGDWDYIDSMTAPDGRSWSFDALPDAVRHWRPEVSDEHLWPPCDGVALRHGVSALGRILPQPSRAAPKAKQVALPLRLLSFTSEDTYGDDT